MTVKRTMRMTIEQEQLIYKLVASLEEANVVGFYRDGYACLLCDGETELKRNDFQHTSDCPLILAQQLRKTINDE